MVRPCFRIRLPEILTNTDGNPIAGNLSFGFISLFLLVVVETIIEMGLFL